MIDHFLITLVNLYKPSVIFCWTKANSADSYRIPQNVASDQGLHCLLTECSILIKNTTQQPLKWKWTGPINKSGKFNFA